MRNKKLLFLLPILLLIVVLFIWYGNLDTHDTSYQSIVKNKNSCLSCHDMQGFSNAHSPNKISCISCHLGNESTQDKHEAHEKMILVPGNLSNASQTCAKCHAGIDLRVKNSIMNTMSGIINVDKYVFGEHKKLDSIFSIHHLKNDSPADNHLRNKCASCHIGAEKVHPNPISEKSRGGGCTACHLNYDEKTKKAHQYYLESDKTELPSYHPSLSLKVSDNHCFGCHSRSGRISTNYEGWHETVLKDTLYGYKNYRVLDDKRVFEKKEADIHHTKGMACIDCHDSSDVMGDGNRYAHQEQATNVSCSDCHRGKKQLNKLVPFSDLKPDEQRIIRLKKMDTINHFLYSQKSDKNLLNVILKNNKLQLITKLSNKNLILSAQSDQCTQSVHQKITCSACHTSWAPQCISCHTSFDKNQKGYDLLAKEGTAGKWIEKGSDYLAEFPSLGVVEENGVVLIKTFSPGMVMSLDQKKGESATFHRLFAPISAHTISGKGKTCVECHNNSVALGYGRGKLSLSENGKWTFKPTYPIAQDGLPQDAWIGFLSHENKNNTTRKNARSFSLKEQQKILKVGACLTCHKSNSKVANGILIDLSNAIKNKKTVCIEAGFY